jgi:hypothetical protein
MNGKVCKRLRLLAQNQIPDVSKQQSEGNKVRRMFYQDLKASYKRLPTHRTAGAEYVSHSVALKVNHDEREEARLNSKGV